MSFVMPNTIANGATRDARPVQANFAAISSALQNDYIRADGSVAATSQLTQASAPTNDSHVANKAYVDQSVPVGVIWEYGGDTAPSPLWLLCQGQLVSKGTYPLLWALFGNKYGASTATQFYLPNLQDRFVVGKGGAHPTLGTRGGSANAVAVAHWHGITDHAHIWSGVTSADGTHNHGSGLLMQGKANGFTNQTREADFGGNRAGDANTSIGDDGYHQHSVSGTTSATIGGNGTITVSQSPNESGVNQNLPPYIVLNKIVRVG